MDFNSRQDAIGTLPGVEGDGDLHNFTDGTWTWFTNHLSQYVANHPGSSENIILLAHHPMLLGLATLFFFGELEIIENYLDDYGSNILAEYSGHMHRTQTYQMGDFMDIVETSENYEAPLARLVRFSSWGFYDHIFLPQGYLTMKVSGPVDLVITDPSGLTVSRESGEILGAYFATSINESGIQEYTVNIKKAQSGNYSIQVIPNKNALPNATFSLEVMVLDEVLGYVPILNIKDRPVSEASTYSVCFDDLYE